MDGHCSLTKGRNSRKPQITLANDVNICIHALANDTHTLIYVYTEEEDLVRVVQREKSKTLKAYVCMYVCGII